MAIYVITIELLDFGARNEIGNRKLKIEDYGKVQDLRFSNSVFRCSFAMLEGIWPVNWSKS